MRSRGLALRVLAQAEPGRPGDSGRACRLRSALGVLRPRLPWPGRHSAWPRRGAAPQASPAARARPPRPESLRRRGSAGGLRCLPPPRPEPLLTRISGRPPTLGRRRVVLAGPAEVWPRPSAPGLPRLELRATRRPLLLPPLPACRPSSSRRRRRLHHATSALSPSLRRSPPSRLHRLCRPRGEAVGEGGPERAAIGVGGGGAEKPSPPSPGQRRRGRGTDTARPQALAAPPWRGPAWCGHFYLRPMAPASRTLSRALPDAPDPPPGFPAALASGRPLKSRLPATSDSSWGLS